MAMSKRNRYSAALLWRLIRGTADLQGFLSNKEKQELDDQYQQYKRAAREEKKASSLQLQRILSRKRPLFPAALGILGTVAWIALLIFHSAKYPQKELLRFYLFQPLLLAAFAPFSLYLLDNLERKLYFRLDARPSSLFVSLLGFTALTMLLASINQDLPFARSPDRFHLTLLVIGVAIAPLFEEIAFRQWLPSKIGLDPHWAGHAISALVFTVLHIPTTLDPEMATYYYLCGATLSLLRIQTDSLLWPFLAHAAANVSMVLAG